MRKDKIINQLLGVFCIVGSVYGIMRLKKDKKETNIELTEKEKKLIAYHEAGHTLAAYLLSSQNKVQEVSIISGCTTKGYTKLEKPTVECNLTKTEIEEGIMFVLAGRVAEKIIFNDISTASRLDLKMATSMATNMVILFGMDDEIGPISFYADKEQAIDFLGTAIFDRADLRIQNILKELENKIFNKLEVHKELLEKIAEELLKKEFLTGGEVEKIVKEHYLKK